MENHNHKPTKENQELADDLLELGKFYFMNSKFDRAIKTLEKAVKLDPRNFEIYYNMGVGFEAENLPDKAKEMYAKTLELHPEHQLAKEHLDKLVGV